MKRFVQRALGIGAFAAVLTLGACSTGGNDAPADAGPPTPLGSGLRISQVTNPASPTHDATGAVVSITGASFNFVDKFDETRNGKSLGTVYLQDTGSQGDYSGISLFSPTYVPADLKLAPGDVVDLFGAYEELTSISATTVFPPPAVLIQMAKPTVTFRYEYAAPVPRVLTSDELHNLNDFAKGRPLMWMLVTVNDVTFSNNLNDDGKGRDTIPLTSPSSTSGVALSNELFDVAAWNQANGTPLANGKSVKSITGIVTWFFNYHIAPRSPDDIVVR